jgi:CubicO group peptidase (beta-lactamase class C family)
MLPEIVGKSTEEFLQDEILKPLGMSETTYYPFASEDKAKHLMPLRYGKDAEKGGDIQWEVLDQQLPLLTLPRE